MIPLQQPVFFVVPPTTLFCSPNIPIYLWNKDMITLSVHYEQQHYPLCTTSHAIMTTTTPPPLSSSTKTKKIDSLSWFASIATSSSLSSEVVQPHDENQKQLLQSQERTNSRTKSKWRKYRQTCKVIECTNKVVKGGVCIRHGASRKLCSYSKNGVKCTSYAHKGGVCTSHGAKKKRCSSVGCTNQAMKGGLCRHHGAYRQEKNNKNNQQKLNNNVKQVCI